MTNTTDQERAEFERELIDNHHYVPSDFSFKDGFYGGDDDYIQFGWDLWQAARRAPAAPVPQVTPEMIEAALEAYMPFGDMELAIQCALSAAPQPLEAAPVELPEPVGVMAPWPLDPSRDYIEWAKNLQHVAPRSTQSSKCEPC